MLDAERHAENASITTFRDALWWTLTTMSTVGYGDRYPVTAEGRLVAGLLMVGGIALLGVITGTIASWLRGEAARCRGSRARDRAGAPEPTRRDRRTPRGAQLAQQRLTSTVARRSPPPERLPRWTGGRRRRSSPQERRPGRQRGAPRSPRPASRNRRSPEKIRCRKCLAHGTFSASRANVTGAFDSNASGTPSESRSSINATVSATGSSSHPALSERGQPRHGVRRRTTVPSREPISSQYSASDPPRS